MLRRDVRHQRYSWRPVQAHGQIHQHHEQQESEQSAVERNQHGQHGSQRHTDHQIGHSPPEAGRRPVTAVADPRLQKQREIVIDGHHEADQGHAMHIFFQEKRNKRVVQAPCNADAEKAEAK
ncbi:hypothetical protein D3C75_893980 [compost metagenome]